MSRYAVIMAGGSGTRFWPKSTKSFPKQFHRLFGDRTMIQQTVDRIRPLFDMDKILVVTNDSYVNLVKEQLPDLNPDFVVGESVAKNTAPCVAIAATIISKKDPGAQMVVLPSDHVISQPQRFLDVLQCALNKASESESLVTIGIKPTRPETGYGYIQFNELSKENHLGDSSVFKVRAFAEKPDLPTAERFLKSGDFLWNSGMFVWNVRTILSAIQKHAPEIGDQVEQVIKVSEKEITKEVVDHFYEQCPSISVDYAIMEKADTVHVVPGDFGWNDVGSWTAVYELGIKDEIGNVSGETKVIQVQAKNNLVNLSSSKLVALVGVEGLAVVETDDAILITKLDKAQLVKDVVAQLKDDLRSFA